MAFGYYDTQEPYSTLEYNRFEPDAQAPEHDLTGSAPEVNRVPNIAPEVSHTSINTQVFSEPVYRLRRVQHRRHTTARRHQRLFPTLLYKSIISLKRLHLLLLLRPEMAAPENSGS